MKRMEITAGVLGWSKTGEPSEVAQQMIRDLEQFQ
jgi:hypothetical protein